MTTSVARTVAAGIFICAIAAAGAAQGDRVQIRLVPLPDQWIQFHATLDMEMGGGGSTDAAPAGTPAGSAHTTLTYTQTTGHPDPDGRVKAEITFEDFSGTITVAGQTAPIAMPPALAERPITAVYDAHGALVDIDFPSALPAATVAQVRQLITSFVTGHVPPSVGIGETVTIPLNVPIPGLAAQASDLSGTSALTLRSVDTRSGERVAHFDQKVESSLARTLTLPGAGGGQPRSAKLTVHTAGAGTMDYNIDRGFVVASQLNTTVDTRTTSETPLPGGGAARERHMTMKMAVDTVY